jgi:hypothetical protein
MFGRLLPEVSMRFPMKTRYVIAIAAATIPIVTLVLWGLRASERCEKPGPSDRILVDKLTPIFESPLRWTTVVFRDEQGRSFIKRVEVPPMETEQPVTPR